MMKRSFSTRKILNKLNDFCNRGCGSLRVTVKPGRLTGPKIGGESRIDDAAANIPSPRVTAPRYNGPQAARAADPIPTHRGGRYAETPRGA
jgi:hypothetical protein